MTYAELGEMLRAEREKRHLTIKDAANELKINPRQLLALEEGDIKLLPHKAYAKGFIRAYASWLGIGKEEIHEMLASLGLTDKSVPIITDVPEPVPARNRKKYLFPFFILLLALALYVGWQNGALEYLEKLNITNLGSTPTLQNAEDFITSRDKAHREDNQEKAGKPGQGESPSSSQTASIPTNQSSAAITPTQTGISQNSSLLPTTSDTPPMPEKNSGGAVNDTSPDNSSVVTPPSNSTDTTNLAGQNKLIIIATEECWIHSNADKTDTRQFSLRKGDTFALTFAKSLELKLGNAGGVRLRYNGQDLPAPGRSGQVKTLSFPPANPS